MRVPPASIKVRAEKDATFVLRQMRINVSDPELVPSLLSFLQARVHVTAEQVGVTEIEISQLGSMNADARRLELDLLLEVWRAANEGTQTAILD